MSASPYSCMRKLILHSVTRFVRTLIKSPLPCPVQGVCCTDAQQDDRAAQQHRHRQRFVQQHCAANDRRQWVEGDEHPGACGAYATNAIVIADIHDAKRAALDLDLLLISGAPSNHAGRNSTGIWGVNRQGCRFSRPAPWMARGGGPPNHWRITGTPSLGEVPSGGARAFCKVSRRQGGTLSGRYLNNGYVPGPTALTVRPSSQASQLPQLDCGASGR